MLSHIIIGVHRHLSLNMLLSTENVKEICNLCKFLFYMHLNVEQACYK